MASLYPKSADIFHQPQSPLFQKLPAEIRNQIFYEYTLPRNAKLITFDSQVKLKTDTNRYRQPKVAGRGIKRKASCCGEENVVRTSVNSLSLTCRLAYRESSFHFYHNNAFRAYDSICLGGFLSPSQILFGFQIQRLRVDKMYAIEHREYPEDSLQHFLAQGLGTADEHIDPSLLPLLKRVPNVEQLSFGEFQGRPRLRSHLVALELLRFLRDLGRMLKHLKLITIDTHVLKEIPFFGKELANKIHYMGTTPYWQRWTESYADFHGTASGPFDENAVMRFEPTDEFKPMDDVEEGLDWDRIEWG